MSQNFDKHVIKMEKVYFSIIFLGASKLMLSENDSKKKTAAYKPVLDLIFATIEELALSTR